MAALTTEFIARYSPTRVRELTLPDAQASASYDATKLAQAAADATEDFEDICGVTLDTSVTKHVRVAVLLMEAYLLEWGTGRTPEAKSIREKAEALAERSALVTGRNRIMPDTTSTLTPSGDGAGLVRPHFDRENTQGATALPPGASDRRDDGTL